MSTIKYLRVASDLHLEAFSGRDPETLRIDFIPSDPRDSESMLILAGDISSHPTQLYSFLKACMPHFACVLFVPGNHEYYRHNFDAWNYEMEDRLSVLATGGNLLFSTGGMRLITCRDEKLRFIYGTLWADGGPTQADRAQVGFFLNDFRLITRGEWKEPRRFTVDDMINEHKASKKQIGDLLAEPFDGRTIVVTHHLPSRRLVSKRFWPHDGSDGANGGFASDCDNMICVHEPWLWVHGHTHDTIDTELWKTRVVCNPAGYRGEWHTPHNEFMSAKDGRPFSVPKFIEL